MTSRSTAEYLNVDLEVRSCHDLKPLVDALFPELHTLYVGRIGKKHFASFEISTLRNAPGPAIKVMLHALSKLPERARRSWDLADDRVFDIGFEQKEGDRRFTWSLRQKTLAEVARFRARIAVSMYPMPKHREVGGRTRTRGSGIKDQRFKRTMESNAEQGYPSLMTTKQKLLKAVRNLPDNATYEDAMERLVILAKIDRGLKQLDAGETIPHARVKQKMRKWLK